jgi:hypothetical protein
MDEAWGGVGDDDCEDMMLKFAEACDVRTLVEVAREGETEVADEPWSGEGEDICEDMILGFAVGSDVEILVCWVFWEDSEDLLAFFTFSFWPTASLIWGALLVVWRRRLLCLRLFSR